MNKKNEPEGISRRNFLGRVGAGIAGSAVIIPAMKNLPAEIKHEAEEISKGKVLLKIKVNGRKYSKYIEPRMTLVRFLREELELTGTKLVCNQGECGGCTVLLDNEAVYSCQMLAVDADGKEVITIEGLMNGEELHPVQEAFLEKDGFQCGFCTPGQIMAAYALLLKNPDPTDKEIELAMSGNLCRCGAYPKIKDSVREASKKIKKN